MPRFQVEFKFSPASLVSMVFMLAVTLIIPASSHSAQPPQKGVNWDSWKFLVGEWVGEGGGQPGQGAGTFTFSLELQNTILVRKNHSEYPATMGRPAFSHDDLMVIYQEAEKPIHAIYFDNEGHVINYTVGFSKDKKSVVFLSEPVPSSPRFRLTYSEEDKDRVLIKFEVAPPGKPEEFAPYIEAKAYKK